MNPEQEAKLIRFIIKGILCFLLFIVLAIAGCNSYQTIDTGHVGVKTKFGRIVEAGLPEGLHFYAPFVGNSIREVDLRIKSTKGDESTFTKDNQDLTVSYSVTYTLDSARTEFIFRNGNEKYFATVAPQIIKGAMKEVIGGFDAETIVSKRAKVNDDVQKAIKDKLATKFITVDNFEVTNFEFNPEYQNAIEAKMIATQRAKEAENKTAQIRFEKEQKILEAQGQAEAMRIKSQAIAQNKNLIEYEAVQVQLAAVNKWNGIMPITMMGSSVPFVNIPMSR